jgi:MacB-like periplasmic core domain
VRMVRATRVAFRAAWSCLRRHRGRSVLTLAVCGLGTAGVLLAGILAQAHAAEVRARYRALGGGLLVVSPNKVPPYPGRARQIDHFISLDPDDATALAAEVPHLRAVVPVAARPMTVRLEPKATRTQLIGTTPDYRRVRNFTLAHGRFFAAADGDDRVIVLSNAGIIDADLVAGHSDVARMKAGREEVGIGRRAVMLHLLLSMSTPITLPCAGTAAASCPTRPCLIGVVRGDVIKAHKDRPPITRAGEARPRPPATPPVPARAPETRPGRAASAAPARYTSGPHGRPRPPLPLPWRRSRRARLSLPGRPR